ncbi:MAG: hypothetical protein JXA28_00185, partial [Bacteroidetes bacterium]|nr:hypothetical protein [Bacteroidota bacterium]
MDFGADWRLDLSGSRSAWLFEDPLGTDELVFGEDPVSRNDLKARLDMGGGRSISALYNDADFEDVTYGAEYRGARDDVVQSLQWGDIRREQGTSLLGQSMGLFGVGGRAVYGERSERYGRSFLEVSGVSGHKTTARHTEVFHGRFNEQERSIADANWAGFTWFYLRADRELRSLQGDRVQLFRERRPGETYGPDDLLRTDIGGMTADWRPLTEGTNYIIDRDNSVLELKDIEVIFAALAVRIYSGGQVTELLLSDGASGHFFEVRNRYVVGYAILPSSFRLRITAPDGSDVPLAQFGIDRDNDGRIDPEFMDYSGGILRFPDPEPFPSAAYQNPPTVTYTMHVRYESFSTGYGLAKRRIIRGSERVLVDGMQMNAGEDYILDYTSGSLVFTRDGAVLDDSRVEISYEHVRNATDERVMTAGVTLSPSDFAQAGIAGGSFHEQDASEPTQFMQGGGDVRWQSEALDLRLQPEYRHTWSDSAKGDAAALSATLSTPAARLSLRSSLRSDGYREPAAATYAGDRLRSDHALQGEYDVTDELRAFASWRQRAGRDTLRGIDLEDRSGAGGLQWVRQDWPSLTLRGEYLDETDAEGKRSRGGGRMDLAWVPSATLLESVGFESARITGYARMFREDIPVGDIPVGDILAGDAIDRRHMQNYFLRTVFSPRPLFTVNAWYQGDLRKREETGTGTVPDYQRDRLFVDLLMEHVRGLSLGGRLTADERHYRTGSGLYEQYSLTIMQGNIRLAPGTWVPALQPFTLYASVQHTESAGRRYVTESGGLFAAFFTSADGNQHSLNVSDWYEARFEWRPSAELLYSLTGRLRSFEYRQLSSSSKREFHEVIQRIDWRPDGRSLYGAQFHYRQDGPGSSPGHARTYNPLLWAERRFSRLLLLRLMLNSSSSTTQTPNGASQSFSLDPSGYITLSLDELPFLRRAELRADAGYSYYRYASTPFLAPETSWYTVSFYTKLYLDLYPHPVLFVRFRYFLRWRDPVSGWNDRILGFDGWEQPDAQLQIIMQ